VGEHRLGPLFTVLATTGLRRGEALGLRWSDVDLDEGRIAVRQTLLAVNNYVEFGEPKTHRSRRTVDLDAATVAVLKGHRKAQLEQRAEAGLGRPRADGLVFTDEQGDPLHPNVVTRTFGKLVREAQLSLIRLHDLRHTACDLVAAGGRPREDRLGAAGPLVGHDHAR
jgi:integrase